jgi:hypothetical protein
MTTTSAIKLFVAQKLNAAEDSSAHEDPQDICLNLAGLAATKRRILLLKRA